MALLAELIKGKWVTLASDVTEPKSKFFVFPFTSGIKKLIMPRTSDLLDPPSETLSLIVKYCLKDIENFYCMDANGNQILYKLQFEQIMLGEKKINVLTDKCIDEITDKIITELGTLIINTFDTKKMSDDVNFTKENTLKGSQSNIAITDSKDAQTNATNAMLSQPITSGV